MAQRRLGQVAPCCEWAELGCGGPVNAPPNTRDGSHETGDGLGPPFWLGWGGEGSESGQVEASDSHASYQPAHPRGGDGRGSGVEGEGTGIGGSVGSTGGLWDRSLLRSCGRQPHCTPAAHHPVASATAYRIINSQLGFCGPPIGRAGKTCAEAIAQSIDR